MEINTLFKLKGGVMASKYNNLSNNIFIRLKKEN